MRNINVDINVLPSVVSDLNNVTNSLFQLIDFSNKLLTDIKKNWDDEQFQTFSDAISENNRNIENLCPEISSVSGQIEQYHINLNNALNNFYRH